MKLNEFRTWFTIYPFSRFLLYKIPCLETLAIAQSMVVRDSSLKMLLSIMIASSYSMLPSAPMTTSPAPSAGFGQALASTSSGLLNK